MESDEIDSHSRRALKGFSQFRDYAKSLKAQAKKRTESVRGRRTSLERILRKSPFRKMPARIYYAIAIDIERTLERHYQIKSGETYAVLQKAATQFYYGAADALDKTIMKNKKKEES